MNIENLSRRDFLVGATALGLATGLRLESAAMSQPLGQSLTIPQALPDKVYTTAAVGISRRTHDEHLKLWQGYARKTNEIRDKLKAMKVDPAQANQIFSDLRSLKADYTFAFMGYVNHEIYFDTLGVRGATPPPDVLALLEKSYGSLDGWKADWKATGIAARGWVHLGYDPSTDTVFNYLGDAQNTFPVWNHHCLLAMDVYEHAYYLDFLSARGNYIDAYMQMIDWTAVAARLRAAKKDNW